MPQFFGSRFQVIQGFNFIKSLNLIISTRTGFTLGLLTRACQFIQFIYNKKLRKCTLSTNFLLTIQIDTVDCRKLSVHIYRQGSGPTETFTDSISVILHIQMFYVKCGNMPQRNPIWYSGPRGNLHSWQARIPNFWRGWIIPQN